MDYSTMIIVILTLTLIYTNKFWLASWYRKLYNHLYPIKKVKINAPLKKTNATANYIQNKMITDINSNIKDKKLNESCVKALSGGKKLRPIIITSVYNRLTNNDDTPDFIIQAALAVEYIHSASLIIDDIMDDDEYRRGTPALHSEVGSTMAQLCAIILCTLAYQNIFKSLETIQIKHTDANKDITIVVNRIIADKLRELTIGQVLDINIPKDVTDIGDNIRDAVNKNKIDIKDAIHKKTSSLFELCFIIPWIYANKTLTTDKLESGMLEYKKIGKQFGLIYQISDDFEDVEQDVRRHGKNSAMNYVVCKGSPVAYQEYNNTVKKFMESANSNNILSTELSEIINYMNAKTDAFYNC